MCSSDLRTSRWRISGWPRSRWRPLARKSASRRRCSASPGGQSRKKRIPKGDTAPKGGLPFRFCNRSEGLDAGKSVKGVEFSFCMVFCSCRVVLIAPLNAALKFPPKAACSLKSSSYSFLEPAKLSPPDFGYKKGNHPPRVIPF